MLSPVSTWMGDCLGTLDAVGFTFFSSLNFQIFFYLPKKLADFCQRKVGFLINFWKVTRGSTRLDLAPPNANGHITLNTPVLVRSLKLSNVESSQYLDGWPPGNTGCCWLPIFYFSTVSRTFFLYFSLLALGARVPNVPNVCLSWPQRALASASNEKAHIFTAFPTPVWPLSDPNYSKDPLWKQLWRLGQPQPGF